MLHLLLTTQGRISRHDFFYGATFLIGVALIAHMAYLISFELGQTMAVVTNLLLYPWICIFVKRFHDAGKSGWMFLVALIVFFVLNMIAALFVLFAFFSELFGPFMDAMLNIDPEASQEEIDKAAKAAQADMEARLEASMEDIALPAGFASLLASAVTAYGINAMLKSDEGPNQYGPPTA